MVRFVRRWAKKMAQQRRRRKLEDQEESVRATFATEFGKATDDEKEHINHQMMYECSEFEDEIKRLDSIELEARGTKVHLSIYDLPVPADTLQHWEQGTHGAWYINDKSRREFARLVTAAEYESKKQRREGWDFWLKVYTAIAASAGAIAGLITLFRHLG
jgi:hypothetical protein